MQPRNLTVDYVHAKKAIKEMGPVLLDLLRKQLKKDELVNTGKLYNSLAFAPTELDQGRRIGFQVSSWASQGWDLYYLLNEGAQPGTLPPSDKIEKWMRTKGIKPMEAGSFVNPTPSAYRRSSFAIAMSIYRKGIIKRFGNDGAQGWEKTIITPEFDRQFSRVMDGLEKDLWAHFKKTGTATLKYY